MLKHMRHWIDQEWFTGQSFHDTASHGRRGMGHHIGVYDQLVKVGSVVSKNGGIGWSAIADGMADSRRSIARVSHSSAGPQSICDLRGRTSTARQPVSQSRTPTPRLRASICRRPGQLRLGRHTQAYGAPLKYRSAWIIPRCQSRSLHSNAQGEQDGIRHATRSMQRLRVGTASTTPNRCAANRVRSVAIRSDSQLNSAGKETTLYLGFLRQVWISAVDVTQQLPETGGKHPPLEPA